MSYNDNLQLKEYFMLSRILLALLAATIGAAVVAVFTTITTAAAFLLGVHVGNEFDKTENIENTEQS